MSPTPGKSANRQEIHQGILIGKRRGDSLERSVSSESPRRGL